MSIFLMALLCQFRVKFMIESQGFVCIKRRRVAERVVNRKKQKNQGNKVASQEQGNKARGK